MKTFVEIGACDFDTCLPLAMNGWAGVLVEPVKELADNLSKQTGIYPFVDVANVVISDYDGTIDFNISKGDGWVRGMSCVASENHQGEMLFDYKENEKYLNETRQLNCYTLDSLLYHYNIKQIDFLKIDTEGHEKNILDVYSWDVKPTFIKMEHSHIDDIAMKKFLEEKGYMVYTEKEDLYAIL